MPAFAILAIYFYKKSEKPFCYALGLALLALTHPYSFIISAFLTLTWFIESVKEKYLNKNFFFIFTILGIFYIFIAYTIFPSPDAYAINLELSNGIYKSLIYAFLIIPADCFITHVCNFLAREAYNLSEMICGSFAGCIFWFFLCYFTKKDKRLFLTFLIPYIPFAICATRYFSTQHLVIPYCFFIFICWITICSPMVKSSNKTIKKFFILLVSLCIIINLYWNFKSCIMDVFITYSKGKHEAEFIKKHNLDKYRIFVEFESFEKVKNPNLNGTWLTVAPYFEKNLFYNFNDGSDDKNYVIHKKISDNEVENLYLQWRKDDLPDIIAGIPDCEEIFKGSGYKSDNYVTVYSDNTSYIHKGVTLDDVIVTIQVKKDLAKKLNLKKVEPQTKYYKDGLKNIIGYYLAKFLVWQDERKESAK